MAKTPSEEVDSRISPYEAFTYSNLMKDRDDTDIAEQILLEGLSNLKTLPKSNADDPQLDWLREKFAARIEELSSVRSSCADWEDPRDPWPKSYVDACKRINHLDQCPEKILRDYAQEAQKAKDPREIAFRRELARRDPYSTHDLLLLARSLPIVTLRSIGEKIQLLERVHLQQEVMRHPNLERTIGEINKLRTIRGHMIKKTKLRKRPGNDTSAKDWREWLETPRKAD